MMDLTTVVHTDTAAEVLDASTSRLVALSNRVRQQGRNALPGAPTTADDRALASFGAAATLMRRTNELLRDRGGAGSSGDGGRHAALAQQFEHAMAAALQPRPLSGKASITHARFSVSDAARAAHEATLRTLSPDREWWRVLAPTGEPVDVRQAQAGLDWPWEGDADAHVIRPAEAGWQSIVRRRYALPTGLPAGSAPLVTPPSGEPLSEKDASAAWLALCGMPPALYISAASAAAAGGPGAAAPPLLERTTDPAVMMRRLGAIDPWSTEAAQLDAAATARMAREADAAHAAGIFDEGVAAPAPPPPADDEDLSGGLPAIAWELAAAPPLDFYRQGAPVATAALAAPAESVAHRVRVAYEAAHGAYRTRDLLNSAADREARLISDVAARRIQHAWRGSRKIAAARAELWGRRERVRSAALHRLATVQDAMVQFCRVLEQVRMGWGVRNDRGSSATSRLFCARASASTWALPSFCSCSSSTSLQISSHRSSAAPLRYRSGTLGLQLLKPDEPTHRR